MMTTEEKQRLTDAATAEGLDPADVIAAAEEADVGGGDVKGTAPADAKVFAYHLPYLRVSEVRRAAGIMERCDDDDMFTGPWLAKHGPMTGGQ